MDGELMAYLKTPIPATAGGTGFATYAVGDLLYANSTTTLTKLSAGFDGQVLSINTGVPLWADAFVASSTASVSLDLTDGILSANVIPGGVDHNALANLTVGDVHTQYVKLTGRATPQQVSLGTASGAATGYISSTSNATKGKYFLNAAGTISVDELNTRVGIGIASPTAVLGLSASTTARASLNIAAGPAPTSPVEGDMWADSTQKAIYMYADGVKQSGPGVLFTQTADKTVTNTVTETSIMGTGVGTATLPANFFVAGKTVRFRIGGVYSTPSLATPSVIVKVKYGATVIATVTTTALLSGATNLEFDGEVAITCRTTGSSGTVMVHGDIEYATGVAGTIAVDPLNNAGATTTINTTTSNALDVTIQWDTATATRIVKSTVTTIEVLN